MCARTDGFSIAKRKGRPGGRPFLLLEVGDFVFERLQCTLVLLIDLFDCDGLAFHVLLAFGAADCLVNTVEQ